MATVQVTPTRMDRAVLFVGKIFRKDYLKNDKAFGRLLEKFDLNPVDAASAREKFAEYKNAADELDVAKGYMAGKLVDQAETRLQNAEGDLAGFLARIFREEAAQMAKRANGLRGVFKYADEVLALKNLFDLIGAAKSLVGEETVAGMLGKMEAKSGREFGKRAHALDVALKIALPVMGAGLVLSMAAFLRASPAEAIGPAAAFIGTALFAIMTAVQHGLLNMKLALLEPLLPKEGKAAPD